MKLKRYNIEYEDEKGIIKNTVVCAKCKEKATETFRSLMLENNSLWNKGTERVISCLERSNKELKPELYEKKKRIKHIKGIEKGCLHDAKKLIKHVKNKKWEEKHPEKAMKRKKPNEPINNI